MKKKILLMVLIAVSCTIQAQEAFNGKTRLISIHAGFGSPYWKSSLKADLPVNPGITYEHGITDNISAGAGLSYSSSRYDFHNLTYRAIFISGRGAWHFPAGEKLDPYAGASVGYVIVSVTSAGYNTSAASGVGYGAFAGIRYYPSKKFGLLAEAGYSSFSFLSAGATIRL